MFCNWSVFHRNQGPQSTTQSWLSDSLFRRNHSHIFFNCRNNFILVQSQQLLHQNRHFKTHTVLKPRILSKLKIIIWKPTVLDQNHGSISASRYEISIMKYQLQNISYIIYISHLKIFSSSLYDMWDTFLTTYAVLISFNKTVNNI